MFEVDLKNMSAVVTIEERVYAELIASNVGVNPDLISLGGRSYSFYEAIAAVKAINWAMRGCPKCYLNRFRAQRNSFIYAFGPEMETFLGSLDE